MNDTPRILCVEDDASWQRIYTTAFSKAEYSVEIASDLSTALAALDRQFFHVAVVDLKLGPEEGNRDGLKVLRRIWELDETLAIVNSGFADAAMYEEFQKMGIFSVAEKAPAEARKAYEAIDFFQGQIRKDESLTNILDKVSKAVVKARQESMSRRWRESPFKILKGISAREVQRSLRAGSVTELRPFLSSLVQPLFPWLQAKFKPVAISDRNDTLAFETLCWSRALGKAVIIRFGRQDSFQKSLELQPIGSAYDLAQVVQSENWRQDSSGHFMGIVRNVSEIDFNKYFDAPPRKKGEGTLPPSN